MGLLCWIIGHKYIHLRIQQTMGGNNHFFSCQRCGKLIKKNEWNDTK